jgi:aminodeoxyfutalosine deaminase
MTPADPRSLIAAWPKAELHLHLEGAIAPQTVVELAARHGTRLSLGDVAQHYSYNDFQGFLKAFKWVTAFLRELQDYALITSRLCEELRRQNVVYAEITLSVGVMILRGQDVAANFAAIRGAERQSGLRLQWIFDATRQFGAEKAMEVARWAARMKGEGVAAFGMGGDELAVAAAEFRGVYDYIRGQGLHALVHAGEVGGPESVREAVEILGAERIGHGIAAVRDPALMEMLQERRIPLEICPTSNLRTGALARLLGRAEARLSAHPLAEFYRRGLQVTLSTDDPAMFATDIVSEYAGALECGLGLREIAEVGASSFSAAFLPASERKSLLEAYHTVIGRQGLL